MTSTRAASDRYLWFRHDSPFIWFRMAVPNAHRSRAGTKLIQFSLGTSDKREARLLRDRERVRLFASWQGGEVPMAKDIEDAAKIVGYDWQLEAMDEGRRAMRGKPRTLWHANGGWYGAEHEVEAQRVATGDTQEASDLADNIIEQLDWRLPRDSDGYAKLCELLSRGRLAALKVHGRRLSGDVEADTADQFVDRVRQRERDTAAAGQGIMDLFDRYASQRAAEARKRADTINQDRKVVEQFARFVGEKRNLRSITANEVRDWRDLLALLPPKWAEQNRFVGMTMREAADRARRDGMSTIAPTTINKYLSTISPLFKWARSNGYASSNPVEGLFYDLRKGENPRPPFSTAQLNKMLSSPLFTGFLGMKREHVAGSEQADDWRKWIPLVCMFTGARIGEIAQLAVDDVRQEHGVWCLHIQHDAAAGQSTKSGYSRVAPVHSQLQAVGFLEFVERQRERAGDGGSRQLFPELVPNKRGQISGTPSRWWRDYLAAIGIKEGRDGIGAHSFRHTIADQLRLADYLDDQIEVALGHNQKTVTSGYGRVKQGTATMLRDMFEAVRFSGVDFEPLVPKTAKVV